MEQPELERSSMEQNIFSMQKRRQSKTQSYSRPGKRLGFQHIRPSGHCIKTFFLLDASELGDSSNRELNIHV